MSTRGCLLVILGSLAALALPGCKPQEEITSYTVPRTSAGPVAALKLTYQVPEGWLELTGDALVRKRGGIQVKLEAGFRYQEGGQVATIEVTTFAGGPERLLADVNRWRTQINLPPVDAQQMRQELGELTVADKPGHYVDITGPEASGADRQRTLGVITQRGEAVWFLKMTGPAELVGQQKTAFEAFVRSVRFSDNTGAPNG